MDLLLLLLLVWGRLHRMLWIARILTEALLLLLLRCMCERAVARCLRGILECHFSRLMRRQLLRLLSHIYTI